MRILTDGDLCSMCDIFPSNRITITGNGKEKTESQRVIKNDVVQSYIFSLISVFNLARSINRCCITDPIHDPQNCPLFFNFQPKTNAMRFFLATTFLHKASPNVLIGNALTEQIEQQTQSFMRCVCSRFQSVSTS